MSRKPARRGRVAADNLPPKGAAEKIERWASEATGVKAIARRLGVSLETLNTWMDRHPELRDAMDAGREAEHLMLYNALLKHLDKSPTPAIFLLKTRHGYREGDQSEVANRVSINFTLPGAQPMATYTATLDPAKPKALEHDGTDD
ncbi:hypothetical protein [Luteimonas sp. e5]